MPLDSLDVAGHLYFITASVIDWIPLFQDEEYAWILLNSFSYFRTRKKLLLFAFAIMPSHFHAILKPTDYSIGKFLQSYGSFTAHAIIRNLIKEQRNDVLRILHEKRRDPRSNYSIWQEIHSENIFTNKFLEQKMEYIHQNPINAKIEGLEDRADFIFSTARFYDWDEQSIIEIDDVRQYNE